MSESNHTCLIFEGGFDERAALDAEARGYRSHVAVQIDGGNQYAVFFYDLVRLKQDLEAYIGEGSHSVAEPGMIIVESVTLSNMSAAVEELYKTGYFSQMKPINGAPN